MQLMRETLTSNKPGKIEQEMELLWISNRRLMW